MPVDKDAGDEVFAGIGERRGRAARSATTRAAGDRTLDRVVKLVEEAQTQKAPTQQFTERFERIFVPAVLVADLLLIVVPPLLGWWTWDRASTAGWRCSSRRRRARSRWARRRRCSPASRRPRATACSSRAARTSRTSARFARWRSTRPARSPSASPR